MNKRMNLWPALTGLLLLAAPASQASPVAFASHPADTLTGRIASAAGPVFRAITDDPTFSAGSMARGLPGLALLLVIAWLFSYNRKAIRWKPVAAGLAIQLGLALVILFVPPVQSLFGFIGKIFVSLMNFSKAGSGFLFGSLAEQEKFGSIFAFQVLPSIIFFAVITNLLFFSGILQKVVKGAGWLLTRSLRVSGAESLVAAGNIFLGQLEAPLLVKGYLNRMTRAEIMVVMVAGMATIASGVMAIYIGFLGGNDPAQRLIFAKHLLAASVMAAPGAIVVARILYPQTDTVSGETPEERSGYGDNLLDALGKGTFQGLRMAVGVGVMLFVFMALVALLNFILGKTGSWIHVNQWVSDITEGRFGELNLQFLFGLLFAPVMWLMGVPVHDLLLVGSLAGEKLVTNEFFGYVSLASLKDSGMLLSDKSVIMSTYLLCGFANFSSVGMLIGGIGILAPDRRKWLTEFGFRAMIGGMLVSLISATIAGMLYG